MKAMLLRKFRPVGERPLERVDIPVPEPGPGEVLLRVRRCGACHTDLHTVEGELSGIDLPRIPGHQVVGIVEKTGRNSPRFKKGDRVGVAWLFSACGLCSFCLKEKENLCAGAKFTGFHRNGGYAQYMVADEKFVYAIPKVFSDAEAAPLLCAGIIGYRALRLSEIKPGETLGLYGFGASAHLAIQVARHWGCEVYVFSRSESHRRLARELGASWTGKAEEKPPAKTNSSIIFAPAGSLVLPALESLEKGGTVALAGIYMTSIPEMDYQKHLTHEKTIRSVSNATRRDGEEFLQIAGEIPVQTTVQVFPLAEANEVLKCLKEGRVNGAAVLGTDG